MRFWNGHQGVDFPIHSPVAGALPRSCTLRGKQPASNSILPSGQPKTCSPDRVAMHISVVCQVNAYASRFHSGRTLGGAHSAREDLSLQLLQRLALHQPHHGLKFLGVENFDKTSGDESVYHSRRHQHYEATGALRILTSLSLALIGSPPTSSL